MEKNHYSKFRKKTNILLTAEHASPRIPKRYRNLGLSKKDCQGAKDLYDPGSLSVMRILEKESRASYLHSNISRLVIDCNRALDGKNNNKNTFHSGAMKKEILVERGGREDLVGIPSNQFSSEKGFIQEEKRRHEKFSMPYQEEGKKIIEKIKRFHGRAIIISIHSFYPVYNGNKRMVDIGILYDNSRKIGKKAIRYLRERTDLVVGDNSPWKMSDADGGAFGKMQGCQGVELLAFDINNKNLKTKKGVKKVSRLILEVMDRITE
ncbi:MAG: N-formylglutamate amidohydrolase [uncultured bacterium]|nr:MAG: N-formylglutamate amidohydrolase [uncultured bacterium]